MNKPFSPKLIKRLLSGLVLAPITIFFLLYGGYPFIGLVVIVGMISLYEWFGMTEHEAQKSAARWGHYIFGLLYLSGSLAAFIFMRFGYENGAWYTLSLLLSVWASDTGAYFTGKLIGGAKLSPHISPNKTWAGFGGAVLFFGGTLVCIDILSDSLFGQPYVLVFLIGCVLGAIGQCGDLFISWHKRRFHLKDTGHLIPGHGGLLDRIDSILLICPVSLALLFLIGQ